MTATELRAEFPAWVQVIFADTEYAKPTLRWLTDKFWPWFQRQRFNLGLNRWTRKNDCDNFARAYAQAAADCHALTGGNELEGLAVGEFFYIRKDGVAHAINVAFTDSGKVFIEPQTGEVIFLTPIEELSAFHVRL